jgi:hypothetical protein
MLLQLLAADRHLEEIPGGRLGKTYCRGPHLPSELARFDSKLASNKRYVTPNIGRVVAVADVSPEAAIVWACVEVR